MSYRYSAAYRSLPYGLSIHDSVYYECIGRDYDYLNLNIVPGFRWLFSFITNGFNESYLKSRMCESILGNNGFLFFKYFNYNENVALPDLFHSKNWFGDSFATQVLKVNPSMKIGNQKVTSILASLLAKKDLKESPEDTLRRFAETAQETVLLKALVNLNESISSSLRAEQSLMDAASDGLPKTVAALLDLNVNVNCVRDEDKMTPLMLAVKFDHLDVTNILLNGGADPKMQNSENLTALDLANENKKWKFVKQLEYHSQKGKKLGKSEL